MVRTHNIVLLGLFLIGMTFLGAQAGVLGLSDSSYEQDHTDLDVKLVEMDDGTELWPYTSRDRAFSTKTLSINVVFEGDPSEVRQALLTQTDGE